MSNINPNIGEVFTPLTWGKFAARTSGIYQAWLAGATVLDPFMGEGALLLSLIDLAIEDNISKKEIPLNRLYGFDWQKHHIETFQSELVKRDLPNYKQNFFVADTFFFHKKISIDIIFTNPPWITFNHLSQARQENLKPLFLHYNLVNIATIIMGGSHVDLAALSLTLVLDRWAPHLKQLVAFIPHSLLTSAAHAPWRNFAWPKNNPLKPQWYYNLSNLRVFPISCDYGLINLTHKPQHATYYKRLRLSDPEWSELPWPEAPIVENPFPLALEQRPRQGINTSGANRYFIFNNYEEINNNLARVYNNQQSAILPKSLVYPLLTSENFKEASFIAHRWIFLPYNTQTGKLLPLNIIQEEYPHAYTYIKSIEDELAKRKGIMLRSYMRRGDFYALLGVNDYTFAPYKVVWQAMGSYQLVPIIVTHTVQANQALHAYIPAYTLEEAHTIKTYLESAEVQHYFSTLDVAGSKSFAQPHRVSQLFSFIKSTNTAIS